MEELTSETRLAQEIIVRGSKNAQRTLEVTMLLRDLYNWLRYELLIQEYKKTKA